MTCRRARIGWFVLAIGLQTGPPAFGDTATTEVQQIIERLDGLYRSQTSYSRVEMTIVTPHWKRTVAMRMWTEGMDKTLITITAPKKDAGISTLRIGTEMWNYFPKIDKVMKVPPSMMMASWMGSDFTNDDLVKESSLVRDYHARLLEGDGARPEHYVIELVPKERIPTVWGKIVETIRKEGLVPVSSVFFDEKGNRMRVMAFGEVKMLGGRRIPSVLEMVPVNKEDRRTVIRYLDAQFDIELDRQTFTRRNLRRRR